MCMYDACMCVCMHTTLIISSFKETQQGIFTDDRFGIILNLSNMNDFNSMLCKPLW